MEKRADRHLKALNELAHEEVMRQIALMIFLLVLCLTGIVGNCLVCYIFTKKYTLSTFRIFVTVLAAVDLFTCSVVIPLELLQFAWQYTYDNVMVCKLNLFVKTWTTITSGFLFLCIAIDRYRRVCRPFGVQISFRAARNMCIGSALLGVAFSWTSLVMYNVQTTELNVYNLTISECAITESMKQTLYPLASNVSLAVLFVGALTGIIIMYSFIAVRVNQQIKKKIGDLTRRVSISQSAEMDEKDCSTSFTAKSKHETFECDASTSGIELCSNSASHCQETNPNKSETVAIQKYRNSTTTNKKQAVNTRSKQRRSSNRTTLIMFMISLAFVISYLPLLCIKLIRFADKNFVAYLTDSERAIYKFVHRSYFLNSAINPIIYGVWDTRFRNSCKMLFACKKR